MRKDLTTVKNKVLEHYNIIDVFTKDGINLISEGRGRYKCLCPFHTEKTPSCKVSEDYQAYTCFGCGEKGDVISYIQKTQQLTFPETILYLAREAKIPVEESIDNEYVDNVSEGYKILEIAYEFYRQQYINLDIKHKAKQEVSKRKLDVNNDVYCYAPESFYALVNYCKSKGISPELLEKYSLAKKDKYGKYRDFFVNRLLFVFKNYMGKPIGFTGRKLSENDKAGKYINSSENPIFHKKQVFFNIHEAKHSARKENTFYIVEGQFDVMAMMNKGYKNVIAASGTSFTEEHTKEVLKLVNSRGQVIFCMDGDKAGITSMFKIFKTYPTLQEISYIIEFPEKQDPCDYLMSSDKLPEKTLMLEYFYNKIKQKYKNLNTAIERKKFFISLTKNFLQHIEDKIIRDEYFNKGANWSYLTLQEATIIFNENVDNKNIYRKHLANNNTNIQTNINNDKTKETLLYMIGFYIHNLKYLYNKDIIFPKQISKLLNNVKDSYTKTNKIPVDLFTNKTELFNKIMSIEYEDLTNEDNILLEYNRLYSIYEQQEQDKQKEIDKMNFYNSLSSLDLKGSLRGM